MSNISALSSWVFQPLPKAMFRPTLVLQERCRLIIHVNEASPKRCRAIWQKNVTWFNFYKNAPQCYVAFWWAIKHRRVQIHVRLLCHVYFIPLSSVLAFESPSDSCISYSNWTSKVIFHCRGSTWSNTPNQCSPFWFENPVRTSAYIGLCLVSFKLCLKLKRNYFHHFFVCTTECNIVNVLNGRLSKSVCHSLFVWFIALL